MENGKVPEKRGCIILFLRLGFVDVTQLVSRDLRDG
jgi:hypothetical protein